MAVWILAVVLLLVQGDRFSMNMKCHAAAGVKDSTLFDRLGA
ncbi:hypothetical protein [Aquabacterium sp.]|nr:hypothetical protein [Aquabacterium sp.]